MTELEVTLTSDCDCDSFPSGVPIGFGLEAEVVSLCVLFHRLVDLQGAVPDEVPQVQEPAVGPDVAAVVHVGRGLVAEQGIGAPGHPLNLQNGPALLYVDKGVGEAAGDGGGGALHHTEGVRVLHVPVRARPQRPWRKQTVGVTTGFQIHVPGNKLKRLTLYKFKLESA